MTIKRLYLPTAVAVTAIVIVAALTTAPKVTDDFAPERYLLRQAPVTDFSLHTVHDALKELEPSELVLGVCIGKESRAYPINMLNYNPAAKVVNDTLGGRPVMATWCDSAHNAIVYSRAIAGKPSVFGVFGQLWKGSMVIYDQDSMTQWSHILGEARRGPLTGKRLERIPSLVTDWETWSRLYPEGTVAFLAKGRTLYTRKTYAQRQPYVLGIAANGRSKAWSFSDLEKQPVINDTWDNQAVLVFFEPRSATARLYRRTVKGQALTFAFAKNELKDQETGTTWQPLTGAAKVGPLAGEHLSWLPAIVSDRKIWNVFHPDSAPAP